MPRPSDRRAYEWRAPVRGLVLAASPRDLPPDALSECTNFDLDIEAGRLIRRDAWLSTAFSVPALATPAAVFEVPATQPAGAPSTPRVVVALVQVASPGLPEWRWSFWMRPWWGGASWITDTWGKIGSLEQGFALALAPVGVSASVVGQDGVYRVYLSYGALATDPPNDVVSIPAWVGFIPSTRNRYRFKDGTYRAEDVGPNRFFAEDLRLLPPATTLITVALFPTGTSGATLKTGGRFYRVAFKYDGYQIGALSDAITLDIPEEEGALVEGTIHIAKIDTIGPRPTHLLVFVETGDRIADGPGDYRLLETVDLDVGPTSKADAVVTDSTVTQDEPVLSRLLGGETRPSVEAWNETPVENLRVGQEAALDSWNRERFYLFDIGPDGQFATVIRRHFHVEVSPGYDWLYRTEKIVEDQNSTWAVAFGSPVLDANTDGSTLLVPGVLAANRLSVRFAASIQHPNLPEFVQSIVAVNDFLLAWDYPYQIGGVSLPRPFRAKPFGRVKSFAPGTGYVDVQFYDPLPSEVGVQYGVYWMTCRPSGLLTQFYGAVSGLSYVVVSAPIFGADAGQTPSSDMLVTIGATTFTEPKANLRATDGTTTIFLSSPTPAYPTGTTTLNGSLVSYGASGWKHDVLPNDWAQSTFMDTIADISTLSSYEELTQDTSLTPWVRGSSAARVGRQHYVADLAIPDPKNRLTIAKDTLQRYQIAGAAISGESGQATPDLFHPESVTPVGEGTSPIRWMGEWFGRLVVLTDESLYLLVPAVGSTLQQERRIRGFGCIGNRTAVLTPDGPVWLGRQGVVRFTGGDVVVVSRPLNSRAFLDAVSANGASAMGAWDARRSRYLLALVSPDANGTDRDFLYTMTREGAWTRYRFPFEITGLCQDSSSSGIPSAVAIITTNPNTYGLVEPDPNADFDLNSVAMAAIARYPEVEPAGGDRFAHVIEATAQFAGIGILQVEVDDAFAASVPFNAGAPGNVRVPVGVRGRTARLRAEISSRAGYIERVALEAVPKGRIRS